MTDIQRTLLGDHEAAKRLTDAGVLLPCCGAAPNLRRFMGLKAWAVECSVNGHIHNTPLCDSEYKVCLAWNTRAPILSESELKNLCKGGEED